MSGKPITPNNQTKGLKCIDSKEATKNDLCFKYDTSGHMAQECHDDASGGGKVELNFITIAQTARQTEKQNVNFNIKK